MPPQTTLAARPQGWASRLRSFDDPPERAAPGAAVHARPFNRLPSVLTFSHVFLLVARNTQHAAQIQRVGVMSIPPSGGLSCSHLAHTLNWCDGGGGELSASCFLTKLILASGSFRGLILRTTPQPTGLGAGLASGQRTRQSMCQALGVMCRLKRLCIAQARPWCVRLNGLANTCESCRGVISLVSPQRLNLLLWRGRRHLLRRRNPAPLAPGRLHVRAR